MGRASYLYMYLFVLLNMSNLLVVCSSHKTATSTCYEGVIMLPEELSGSKKITLQYAMVPNTVYTFNDSFTFEEGAGGPKTVTLTGAYTGVALATYLSTWMTANSTAGDTYTVTYNTVTGKFEFVNTLPTAHSITITTANLSKRMGFAVGTEVAAATHTSSSVADLSPPKGCLLEISGLQNAKKLMTSSGGSLGHFFIPMTADSFGIVDYFELTSFANVVELGANERLKVIQYRLLDAESRLVLQVQTDWMVVLKVE